MSGNRVTGLAPLVRTVQIVVAALTAGCILFMVVAIAVAGSPKVPEAEPVITWLAAAVAVALVLSRLVVPAVIVARSRRKIQQGVFQSPVGQSLTASIDSDSTDRRTAQLAQVFVSKTILGAAILEGGVFFLLIAYLVEHSPMSLMLAGLLIVVLALHLPSCSQVESWIEEQTRRMDEEQPL